MQPDLEPIRPARIEWQGDTPWAPEFGDCYFSRDGGPAESRTVFLHGNRLEERFRALRPGELFVVGETGFGTGLNLLLTARAFLDLAPPQAFLALLSAELHPLDRADLGRALASLPELGEPAAALLAQYPAPCPGFHRLRLAPNVELTLMFGDAERMWRMQRALVDAWFLDGFAPDRNPSAWTPALCRTLAARSRPGTTLASFSVAAPVRTALEQAGFLLQRAPGHGRKRHRLEGRLPGAWTAQRLRRGTALVVGAGLAGATSARALAERGWRVTVADAEGIAAGASGNRAGVVYTTPSGFATPQNRFYQSSYLHALSWFARHRIEEAGIGRLDGVVQHLVQPRQQRRMAGALGSGHWPAEELEALGPDRVLLRRGGWLKPAAWCRRLLTHPEIELRRARLRRVACDTDGCLALEFDDRSVDAADATVLCTAGAVAGLDTLPLRAIRGQVTEVAATAASAAWRRAECHEGYLTPAVDGRHCIGATFDLHRLDPAPRASDDQANLEQLRRRLPDRWQALGGAAIAVVGRRVGFRIQSRDYLPLIGPAPGTRNAGRVLWLNLAHGSRGITGTPLCADLLADALSGSPCAADAAIVRALDPGRFDPDR